MSIPENHAGGAGGEGSGAPSGDDSSQNSQQNQGGNSKTVSWDNHKRVLDDMHTFKKKVSELETKLGDIESEKLKATNDFKTLYETEKEKRERAEAKANETLQWAANTQRFSVVKAEAEKQGLKKEAIADLELLDMSDIKVEATSTGRFIVEGAEDWVNAIKSKRSHWFTNPNPPPINGGGGGTPPSQGTGKLSPNDLVDAERKMKRGLITRAEYEATYQKYVAQEKQAKQVSVQK